MTNPEEKALGEGLFEMFKANAVLLKTNHVIYNWKEWSPGSAGNTTIGRSDKRGPHTNHVHVDFVDDALDTPSSHIKMCALPIWSQMRLGPYKG